ncbi:MAG: GyrI-like domain-containing protein [Clostridia bacterium]
MLKQDSKKAYKDLYAPKSTPGIIVVPPMNFILVEGEGDPNGEDFSLATAALYSVSYAVKMSYKSTNVPAGYTEYKVFPLEGVWDLIDKNLPATVKNNFKYQLMIRQPEFLTAELFADFLVATKKKKPNIYLEHAKFITLEEGLCCQLLHLGSYDSEPASFSRMEEFCQLNGYNRKALTHREIYLSDPRKTVAEKLKTVLRFQVSN